MFHLLKNQNCYQLYGLHQSVHSCNGHIFPVCTYNPTFTHSLLTLSFMVPETYTLRYSQIIRGMENQNVIWRPPK